MNTPHTPLPWYVAEPDAHNQSLIVMGSGAPNPKLPHGGNFVGSVPIRKAANADLIVRAVNSFEAMRNTVQDTLTRAENAAKTFPNSPGVGDFRQIALQCRAALALADGKEEA